ncbi:MAG: ABC transporter permease [Betaproteobacteria bacterium]|nr:ABC transporter permease [Betaproteobacteria bacterium]
MAKILHFAWRNLLRYRRRTLLTGSLIALSVVAVLLFVSLSGSFKNLMIGQMTDSMLGHLQVHRRGYVASIDNLPLNLNLQPGAVTRVEAALKGVPGVVAWSPRVKLGAGFTNFQETTSIRLNGIDPEKEASTTPALAKRVSAGDVSKGLVARGEVLIPDLLARGMKVSVGDTAVLIATNRDGSVNGKTFVVRGVLEGITGPGGRDGYLHIDDARELLRMDQPEVSEIVVRLGSLDQLDRATAAIRSALDDVKAKDGRPALEVHTWEALSPFSNIARMIDLMTVSIKVMLVAIVLISIMNVMVMAVYERIREIGTLAALGTRPGQILSLFLAESVLLGLVGIAVGAAISVAAVAVMNVRTVSFAFGRRENLALRRRSVGEIATVGAMVLAMAVLAGLHPAWKASRMDPIKALRHV